MPNWAVTQLNSVVFKKVAGHLYKSGRNTESEIRNKGFIEGNYTGGSVGELAEQRAEAGAVVILVYLARSQLPRWVQASRQQIIQK